MLQQAGLRVIVPDQIGFCKSAKPDNYSYSFAGLADNTRALLTSPAAPPLPSCCSHTSRLPGMGSWLVRRSGADTTMRQSTAHQERSSAVLECSAVQ